MGDLRLLYSTGVVSSLLSQICLFELQKGKKELSCCSDGGKKIKVDSFHNQGSLFQVGGPFEEKT